MCGTLSALSSRQIAVLAWIFCSSPASAGPVTTRPLDVEAHFDDEQDLI